MTKILSPEKIAARYYPSLRRFTLYCKENGRLTNDDTWQSWQKRQASVPTLTEINEQFGSLDQGLNSLDFDERQKKPIIVVDPVISIRSRKSVALTPRARKKAENIWSKESILPYLRHFGADCVNRGVQPCFLEYRIWRSNEPSAPNLHNIRKIFGTWADAHQSAGGKKVTVKRRRCRWNPDIALTKIKLFLDYCCGKNIKASITNYGAWARVNDAPSSSKIYKNYGGWLKALALTGHQEPVAREPLWTEDSILLILKRFGLNNANGKTRLSKQKYKSWRKNEEKTPHVQTIMKRFGSWEKALQDAGFVQPAHMLGRSHWKNDTILPHIHRFAAFCAKENVKQNGVSYGVWSKEDTHAPSIKIVCQVFGNFKAARQAVGSIDTKYIREYRKYNIDKIIYHLHRFALSCISREVRLSVPEYIDWSKKDEKAPSYVTIYKMIGGWKDTLQMAGLTTIADNLLKSSIQRHASKMPFEGPLNRSISVTSIEPERVKARARPYAADLFGNAGLGTRYHTPEARRLRFAP